MDNKRIIEFHGDLWHGNPLLFEASDRNGINGQLYADKWKYDAEKKETAEKNGFEVMVVWEWDYKYYKEDVIEKSKDFIFNGVDIDIPECKCCRNKEIKSFKLF